MIPVGPVTSLDAVRRAFPGFTITDGEHGVTAYSPHHDPVSARSAAALAVMLDELQWREFMSAWIYVPGQRR